MPGDYEQVESRIGYANAAVGDLVRFDTANGQFLEANAGAAGTAGWVGILLSAGPAGTYATAIEKGEVAGFDLSGRSFYDPIYASNNSGNLADAAGTVSTIVGRVYPARASGATLDKVLKVGV
jgi:hypothetical protein